MINQIDISFPSISDIYAQNKAITMEQSSQEASFVDLLKKSIGQLDNDFTEAENSMNNFLLGQGELQDVLMTTQKVNMEFRLALQVRSKLLDAYKEIMNMSI